MTSTAPRVPFKSVLSFVALAALATGAPLTSASAQSAQDATLRTLQRVDSLVARNDSLGALGALDSALVRDRTNGPLWHRYGQIAWGMSKTEKGPVMRPHMIRLRQRADSAIRYAAAFAPDSATYFLDLGLYQLEADNVFMRAGAKGNFDDGIKVARAQGRDSLAAALIDQKAMFEWREYDNINFRALEKTPDDVQSTPASTGTSAGSLTSQSVESAFNVVDQGTGTPSRVYRHDLAAFYRENLSAVTPPTGLANYTAAMTGFRNAAALDSSNARVRRHIYMALADFRNWRELLQESDRILRADGENVDAWLSRGLAASSLEDYPNAAAAFDNALKRMTAAERQSFTNIRRLLGPPPRDSVPRAADEARWARMPAAERKRIETQFWNLADPRVSTGVNEAMVEFFARVTYADLRFGSEEFRIRGADSDRGDTWVRYGLPDNVYSVKSGAYTVIIWVYNKQNMVFRFQMAPTFGTAYVPFGEAGSVDSIRTETPNAWTGMPLVRRTWPMRTRVARFRATADSIDAVITATVPVRSFLEGAELGGDLPIAVQLDINDPNARIVGREVRKVNVRRDSLPVGINGAWVRRLGRGTNVVRIDAEQMDVQRAASSMTDAVVDTTSGFGISDLLLGANPRVTGTAAPSRWRDVSIAPTTGVFPWEQSVGVVWEAYELTPLDGNVRYKVNVELARTFKNNARGLIARIAAYSKNVIERDGSGTGSVSLNYEQLRAASPVTADFLSINLRGSVPGTYKLTIEIEDLVGKRTTQRTTTFDLTRN